MQHLRCVGVFRLRSRHYARMGADTMIFKNASGTCPRCNKRRSAHTPAEARLCSAWNKANLTPGKPRKAKRVTTKSADGLATVIHKIEGH